MDPHSLNRRLSAAERIQIEMGGDLRRAREDLDYLRGQVKAMREDMQALGKQVLRAQSFAAAVIVVLGAGVTVWTWFGPWIVRQMAVGG